MSVEKLIESALEQAGTIVAIVVHPERGSGASLRYVNQAFASFIQRTRASLQGASFGEITACILEPTASATLLDALVSGKSLSLDLPFRVEHAEKWLGLRVTMPAWKEAGARHAIITGRDITETRNRAKHESDFRRLLASVFIRISAPVAIVTSSGEIQMANPAFTRLHGYTPEELTSLTVDDLTPPEHQGVARLARAKQLGDGERYEMKLEVLAKGGARIPVRLTSVLLRDGNQRMRVVTLVPEQSAEDVAPKIHPPENWSSDRGELRAISLEAFRLIFGDSWERIASRAMLRADQIIRRKLEANDTVSRVDDHRFMIWFESADHEQNETILAALVREIRLRFLTEFGEQAAEHVAATLVPAGLPSSGPNPSPGKDHELSPRNKTSGSVALETATLTRFWKR